MPIETKVRTKDGHEAGHVKHAIWDANGQKITEYVIATGGLLGHDVVVSPELLEGAPRKGDEIVLNIDKHELDELAHYESDDYAPPPAEWVAAVRALIEEHADLPPLLDGDPAAAGTMYGRWALHPWSMFADLATLLAWAAYLDGPLAVWRAGTDGPLYVYGLIAGYPTVLVGHSSSLPRTVPELNVAFLEEKRAHEEQRWAWARLCAVAS